MQRGLLLVDLDPVLRLRIFHVPIHIDDVRCLLKDLLDLSGDINLASSIGTVDFGHQRLHNGRARRNLAYLDPRTVRQPDLLEFGPEALRDLHGFACCDPPEGAG